MSTTTMQPVSYHPVRLHGASGVEFDGMLAMPRDPRGLVIIANATGDATYDPGNEYIAEHLRDAGFATLDVCLLTEKEAALDAETSVLRFDVRFAGERLMAVTRWAAREPKLASLEIGYFTAGLSSAAAMVAAAAHPAHLRSIVCRGGRVDLAGTMLGHVDVETLLLLGERDQAHLENTRRALSLLPSTSRLRTIDGGGHLLDDQWALKEVADLAIGWFGRTLHRAPRVRTPIRPVSPATRVLVSRGA